MDVVLWVLLIVVIVGAVWWFRFHGAAAVVDTHSRADPPTARNKD
ncbi:hypothetical protein [Arthrobacter flavus]|uniref:Uncharacterized protein n=1 Tax=Arthrobacter flavus TaxID=95172 RepID=A0ABW4QAL7_9MICC